jgi:hypothetical protein
MKKYDMAGQRFGRLVVTRQLASDGKNKRWECQCDCGGSVVCVTSQLMDQKKGRRSCGCLQREHLEVMRARPKKKQAVPPKMVFNGQQPCLLATIKWGIAA